MKSDFKFSNLCGTVYKQGSLCFSPDGTLLYSPVGNRVTCFDLASAKSYTFPVENRKTIAHIALSPNGGLLLSIDDDGHALLVSTNRRVTIAAHHFKQPVRDAQFSPDGKFIAVTHGKHVQVWKTPGYHREFAPFVLVREYAGHLDDVVKVNWRSDSKYVILYLTRRVHMRLTSCKKNKRMFLSCGRDMTTRLFTLHPHPEFKPITLAGHKATVVAAWWVSGTVDAQQTVHTVGMDGSLFMWDVASLIPSTTPEGAASIAASAAADGNNDDDAMETDAVAVTAQPTLYLPAKYAAAGKHYFNVPHAKVVRAEYHRASRMLVVGFNSGVFGLWEMPGVSSIHSLSLGKYSITGVAVSPTGDWLAFGSAALGQLVVWEWQSESYVLKQQGHTYDLTTCAYSAQGHLASGGDDAKVKLWNDAGLCFVTLDAHTAPIVGLQFAKNGRVLFSASLDGTVRAWDMARYRNFKTYTTPSPAQFGCVAIDETGDLVCAGSVDSFEVYVWAVQTGKLLDVFPGHTAPVSCMAFAGNVLVTGSWDRSVRVWNLFDRSMAVEPLPQSGEVLALAVRPDNQHVAVATLDGMIAVWHARDAKQVYVIDARRDLKGGRKLGDLVAAENSSGGKCFTSLTYSADGEYLLAGGRSKYICIYHVKSAALVRRFPVSHNLALDGLREELNSRHMTDAGVHKDMLEREMDDDEAAKLGYRKTKQLRLPGASRGDLSDRSTAPEIRTSCVRFAPTGRAFAAASTEGLLLYSLDEAVLFDPLDLDLDVTPAATLEALAAREYAPALMMSLRLNERPLIVQCVEGVPPDAIGLIAKQWPAKYVAPLLRVLASLLGESRHLEFVSRWCAAILRFHARLLREGGDARDPATLRMLKKFAAQAQTDLGKVADENTWTLRFLTSVRRDPDFVPDEPEQVDGAEGAMAVDL
ncbi:WD40 repeat-like protein [Blastocladiella britannica]|nr:WD40 repeat-like protein [Blastocladiella britannica]